MTIIGIVTKPTFPQSPSILEELIDWLRQKQKTVLVGACSTQDSPEALQAMDERLAAQTELVLVLGGDGTMLRAARLVEKRSVPILGVNLGGLGFLTETTLDTMYDSLEKVFAQEFYVDGRLRLQAHLRRHTGERREGTALNDVVISKGTLGRMITTDIQVDQRFVTTLRGDGLIVSSPTGSTAYSTSAGGPIVDPALEALVLTPISPHTLTYRPLLVPSHVVLDVQLTSREGGTVTFDGQTGIPMEPDDIVTIRASPHRTRLVRFPDRTHYDVLRNKLKWGDG